MFVGVCVGIVCIFGSGVDSFAGVDTLGSGSRCVFLYVADWLLHLACAP